MEIRHDWARDEIRTYIIFRYWTSLFRRRLAHRDFFRKNFDPKAFHE